MPKYPNWGVGLDASANNFALGIPNIIVKAADQTILNSTTLTNDSELANIPLAVGTHYVKLYLMTTNAAATADIKTQWAFSGTWSAPLRMCRGPASSNTATADSVTPFRLSGIATNANATYGLGAGGAPAVIEEVTYSAVVTVAGNLTLQWAQNTIDAANGTVVKLGSAFETRQIA